MLNDLILLGYSLDDELPINVLDNNFTKNLTHTTSLNSIQSLIEYLITIPNFTLKKNNSNGKIDRVNNLFIENELDYSVIILINPTLKSSLLNNDSINNLDLDNLVSLINYRFLHLNPIIIYSNKINYLNHLNIISNNISTRLTRINCWIGFNKDNFNQLNTMINYLNLKIPSNHKIVFFTNLLSNFINYDNLLLNINHDNNYYLNLLNNWDFNAFQFNIDELLQIGYLILIPYIGNNFQNELKSFLFFIRDNYKIGNPFHNFRHAIDVLQATNYFLNCLINEKSNFKFENSQILSLLLSSLGHDIGHPGITNAFLINLNSPLSIKFNKISILENFHKFQFNKILIPFKNQINLKIDFSIIDNSILATDMENHDYFVSKISNLKFDFNNFKLLSCILIKCADISNVCRLINTSCKWGLSLNEEFKQISLLENYFKILNINLLNDNLLKNNFNNKSIKEINVDEGIKLVKNLNKNQLFFINRFASDFFTKISLTIPQLKFLNDNLVENTKFWQSID